MRRILNLTPEQRNKLLKQCKGTYTAPAVSAVAEEVRVIRRLDNGLELHLLTDRPYPSDIVYMNGDLISKGVDAE